MEQGHNWKAANGHQWSWRVNTKRVHLCTVTKAFQVSADQLTNMKRDDAVQSGGGGDVGTSSTRY